MPILEKIIDPNQCGGLKNTSIQHYLIKLLEFVHSGIDKKTPHAVVMAALDLSKAYNRGDHSKVLEDLFDMHTPGWLLALLFSYLSDRKLVLKYQKTEASPRALPGVFGAGTWMGGFLFIVKFNGICLRPPSAKTNIRKRSYSTQVYRRLHQGSNDKPQGVSCA